MATKTKRTGVRFRERAELLDFLLEVTTATSETLDLDRLLPTVADFVQRVVPHDLFAILLLNEKPKGLRIRYARGHRDEVVHNLIIPIGEGITGAAAASRHPELVGDVRRDPRYLNALDAVRSELAVPMIARGKLVGIIDVQSTREAAFSEQDRSLLRLIASRVASAIDNARLYRRVERTNKTLRTLSHLSQEFSAILDLDELLGRVAKGVHRLIHYDAFSVLLVDAAQGVLRHRFSARYDERVTLSAIPLGKGITGAAVETRQTVRVPDTALDPRYIAGTTGIRSELAVPLVVADRVVGVMDLESDRLNYFSDEHVRTLGLLAPQVASSVENARLYEELAQREGRMEGDLKAARKLQQVLLPRQAPPIEGLEIEIGLRPARDISGDLYDFFHYGDGRALLAFGDVSGKGAAAALYGALVSGLLRTLAPQGHGPARLLRELNEALLERKVDAQYVTLLLMLWDRKSAAFTVATAGALPPMVCRDGSNLTPGVEGVPLGLLEDRTYDEVLFQAQPGDVLVLYSDGVEDQVNDDGDEFGHERLFQLLRARCAQEPQGVVDAVFAGLDEFRGGTALSDDQTLVALRVSGDASCRMHIDTK